MVLDATVKGPSANSYLTVAEADALLAQRLYVSKWTAAVNATKEAALQWATNLLDQGFNWEGSPTTVEQALRWPRGGTFDSDHYYFEQNTLPDLIKRATAELALELVKRDRVSDPDLLGLGFVEAKVGSLNIKIDPGMVLSLIPRHIVLMVAPLGAPVAGATNGGRVVNLTRS